MRTTRVFVAACAVAMICFSFAAPSSARTSPRQETHQYNTSSGSTSGSETNLTELTFSSQRGERFILVDIEDRTGATVRAVVTQAERSYEVCGTTEQPLRIAGGPDLVVRVEGGCDDGVAATSGSVTMSYFESKGDVRRYLAERPATTTPRVERNLSATYYLSSAIAVGDVGSGTYYGQIDNDEAVGGAIFQATEEERFVSISITDAAGEDVWAYVSSGPPGEYPTTRLALFCTKTDRPVEFPAGSNLQVALATGACGGGNPSAPTTGTIDVTLSNVP
ncbi:MAG: hypothetical protein M3271_01225 [Actinomycetota bacterium]|nr:hypothetical protein [Actinomycetota bacterium]